MPRLFPALCLAVFACIAPACDDEEPTEPGTTADDSAAEDGESGSSGEPAGTTTTGEADSEDTAGSSETGEQPGTATIAPPKLNDLDDDA